jgi:hypothetical protein
MREQINSNPLVQLAVIGVLLVGVAIFVMSSGGGGEEEESAPGASEATVVVADEPISAAFSAGQATTPAPPPPRPVLDAWRANKTIVLLFVRDGGIDDRQVKDATGSLAAFPDAAVFVVPAARIARYAAIAEGVGVERVPALVAVTPKHLNKTVPTASVSYGFQSPASVRQAVIDAGYKGKTLDYHP